MQDWLLPYAATIWALGAMGGDVAGIRAGHVPGAPVVGDHSHFFFRVARAHANTSESIAAFVLLALFGVLHGAAPGWLNLCAVVYVGARIAHMLCYYAGLKLLRSGSFVVAFLALVGMLVAGAAAALR